MRRAAGFVVLATAAVAAGIVVSSLSESAMQLRAAMRSAPTSTSNGVLTERAAANRPQPTDAPEPAANTAAIVPSTAVEPDIQPDVEPPRAQTSGPPSATEFADLIDSGLLPGDEADAGELRQALEQAAP